MEMSEWLFTFLVFGLYNTDTLYRRTAQSVFLPQAKPNNSLIIGILFSTFRYVLTQIQGTLKVANGTAEPWWHKTVSSACFSRKLSIHGIEGIWLTFLPPPSPLDWFKYATVENQSQQYRLGRCLKVVARILTSSSFVASIPSEFSSVGYLAHLPSS